jgi:beta-1,4-mannosyltransferase
VNVIMVSRVQMNPYVRLLATALQEAEPGLSCTVTDTLSPALVGAWRGKVDIMHLHWPELLYQSRSPVHRARRLAGLLLALAQARSAGICIVYTAHNVRRHDEPGGILGSLADAAFYRLADVVHVHDEQARTSVLPRHPRRVEVIAHGNYIGAYRDTCTRAEARRRLALDAGAFVFLSLGQVRPYKGLDDLVLAFSRLPGADLRLLIAGNPHDSAYGETLVRSAAGDGRIRIEMRFVPDNEVQYYMRAADACVLPYRSATTSGAAILALSFGRPVIAPDVPPFRGLISAGSGVLYGATPGGLEQGLLAALQLDSEKASESALAVARSLDWLSIARRHAAVYRSIRAVPVSSRPGESGAR